MAAYHKEAEIFLGRQADATAAIPIYSLDFALPTSHETTSARLTAIGIHRWRVILGWLPVQGGGVGGEGCLVVGVGYIMIG